ncbi:MAG: SO_0444 family Cu/Zn efflux transporter, partial [Pseudomonadota bacterium]
MTSVVDILWRILQEIGLIFYESSVFILLGFTLAGILHEFVPMQLVAKRLGKPGIMSVVWATVLGAPLPLCSCGVLPTAAALRRKGASKPAVASFIVSVPETGVDSIAVSYGLMGPIMAIYRPIVAVVTALSAGIACLFITRDEPDDIDAEALQEIEEHDHDHAHGHDHSHDHAHGKKKTRTGRRWRERMLRMAGYGYRTVLDEVAFWIVAGLVVTGILLALLPEDFFSSTLGLDSGILPMLLMAVIGVPLYTCASMSTPIAAGLIATGLSPGAALVFLLAGPATSIASLTIVGKLLGRRSMAAYLLSILVVAIGAGLLLDSFAADQIRAATVETFNEPDGDIEQAFKALCALIFLGMFVDSLGRKSYEEPLADIRKQGSLMKAGLFHVRRLGYGIAAAALVIAAIPAFTLRVDPGENGMIMRFGKVVEPSLEPGLYFHLPWPVHTTRVVDVADIREIFVSMTTTEFLTSDENVIAVTSAIQYRVDDAYAYEFRGEKNVDLLRDIASRILVQEALSRPIDDIYTTERSAVEREYSQRLAKEISALGLGFELVEARLEHVHAPESVHDSFRDVSSALEDRQKSKFEAESRAIEMVTEARGRHAESVAVAEGDATARIRVAEGLAASFVPQAETLSQQPEIGRYRLRLEAIERSFASPRKYLNTVPG